MAEANVGPPESAPDESGSGEEQKEEKQEEEGEGDRAFECNICLDTARDAVVSMCGHLFCWPCLHQWLETRPNRQICPVCKAGISKDKVIPLYGRGNSDGKDPREKVPPRPQGQRAEPTTNNPFSGFGFGGGQPGGFHMSFGIGGRSDEHGNVWISNIITGSLMVIINACFLKTPPGAFPFGFF